VAHAEASARTIEAAVATAAAQLGLRADQVDVEILEEPVPSTFGYIGSPARVRVTPGAGSGPGDAEAAGGRGRSAPEGAEGTTAPAQSSGPAAGSGSVSAAGAGSEPVSADAVGLESTPVPSAGSDSSLDRAGGPSASTPSTGSGSSLDPAGGAASTPVLSAGSDLRRSAGETGAGAPVSGSGPTPTSAAGPASSSGPASDLAPAVDQPPPVSPNGPDRSNHSHPSEHADSPSTPGAGAGPAETVASDEAAPSAAAQATGVAASPSAQPSSTTASGSNGDRGTERDSTATPSPRSASSTTPAPSSESPGTPRPSRRTNRDEPIDPAVIEADTERGGDFLEGLLDALDVDGDITTWVDEAGGHIDLEGSDLDALVGSNGETLDALQELTRLAVLRQSKRRVRLLLDINGFRARQRERLVSMVKATAEQVIRTREDHEFQPMTPAERKIVHDAVAAIDGARTESLGEDPHRRVVIRPA
jgi:spoIIIJ-associated protein